MLNAHLDRRVEVIWPGEHGQSPDSQLLDGHHHLGVAAHLEVHVHHPVAVDEQLVQLRAVL